MLKVLSGGAAQGLAEALADGIQAATGETLTAISALWAACATASLRARRQIS